jgi:hypothetical protein
VRFVTIASAALMAALVTAPVQSAAAAERVSYRAAVSVSGQVTVSFHGDRAAGCEAAFRCDVQAGTFRWTPQPRGQLSLSGVPGRRLTGYVYFFGGAETTLDALAIVQRSAADGTHVCADGRGSSYSSFPVISVRQQPRLRFGVEERGGVFGPLGATRLGTNCGGPLPADTLRRLPTRTVRLRKLVRGPTTIDLSDSAPFAAGGFAGTVDSSVVLRVRKVRVRHVERRPRRSSPRPPDRPPVRFLSVEYRLARLSGSVGIGLAADPRGCAVLDACGLSGTLRITPGPARGEAYVIAEGHRSRIALRRAVGLAQGPSPSRVGVYGYLVWLKGRGRVTAELQRNGQPACRDTSPLTDGAIDLRVRGRRVTARFAGGAPYAGADILRTRCPGPLLADLGRGSRLAVGRIPRRALGRRRVTIHLDQGNTASAAGYSLHSRPDLTVVLEREKIEERTLSGSGSGVVIDEGGGGVAF